MHRRRASSLSSSQSLSSSSVLSTIPQSQCAPSQYGHVDPFSNTQEDVGGLGHLQTESSPVPFPLGFSPSVPPYYSADQSNTNGNTDKENNRFMICSFGDS